MIETRVELQPAFILQTRNFRETSLIVDLFTRDYGIVAVLVKGVRNVRSKTIALLQPFKALCVSFSGKAELKTLTHVELMSEVVTLEGWGVYCGFYVNELISRFLLKHDPHPEVYTDYVACLLNIAKAIKQPSKHPDLTGNHSLSSNNPILEAALRVFEINLMQHVGFALQTQYDANNEAPIKACAQYFFQIDRGAVEHPQGTISGKTLQALATKRFTDLQTLMEAKRLMRSVIDFHLQGQPLKTRAIISKIQQKL